MDVSHVLRPLIPFWTSSQVYLLAIHTIKKPLDQVDLHI